MEGTSLKPKNIYFYPEPLDASDPSKNSIEANIEILDQRYFKLD